MKMVKEKEKYIEGECESCGLFGKLHNENGKFLCEDCRDEEGNISEEDAETEED